MADLLQVVVDGTTALLTIAEAKQHLRVESSDEDDLIVTYANAAVLSCLTYCDLKLVPVGAEPAFKVAALMALGDIYSNREAVLAGQSFAVSPSIAMLLGPWRIIRI